MKTLKKVEWKNTRLVKENIAEEIFAQTFMKLGLIDEYRIIVHPVILGKGKPLFKDIKDRINLKLLETRKFNSGSVGLSYRSDTKEVIKA